MHITPKMKDKCIFQMMKKGACLASLLEIQHEMQKFNTCHHCKFLYPDYLLVTCKFSSDKQAIPKINMEAICDTNIN
jgi:ketopantoate reductase